MEPNIFEKILVKLIKSEGGIRRAILVDKTGLTIAHASKLSSYYPIDIEGIGAIASAIFVASEEQGKSLDIGDLQMVTSEFENGKIFAASCGQGVLCLITDPDVNIGMIRLLMKRAAAELGKLLNDFLRSAVPIPVEKEKRKEEEELKAALDALEQL